MAEALQTLTISDYKSGVKPTWCPGCGDFAVLAAAYKTLADLQLKPEQVVVVSGIGCSSRIPYFLRSYGVHTLHGRAIPVATGVKLARPDLTVFVMGGDGDFFAIGAGHFPHGAARNLDIAAVCMNNQVYGLTKGQASPTSRTGHVTKSTPYGVHYKPATPVLMALTAGATFVARAYSGKAKQLTELLTRAVKHKGFAFVEVISPCTEFNNTYNLYDGLVQELDSHHDVQDIEGAMHLVLTEKRVNLGIFYQVERPTYEDVARHFEKDIRPLDIDEYLRRFE